MTKVTVDANTKGEIGEAVVLGTHSPPEPVIDKFLDFLSDLYPMGENPDPTAKIRRDVYFNATTEDGEEVSWKADGRITVRWSSPEIQAEDPDKFQRQDMEAVFPVDVKTGKYAELERNQLNIVRAIAIASNNAFPAVINVSIGELPDSFDVTTKIFGRDLD